MLSILNNSHCSEIFVEERLYENIITGARLKKEDGSHLYYAQRVSMSSVHGQPLRIKQAH